VDGPRDYRRDGRAGCLHGLRPRVRDGLIERLGLPAETLAALPHRRKRGCTCMASVFSHASGDVRASTQRGKC
jgi:hypothetical protein